MRIALSSEQISYRESCKHFVNREIVPYANQWDKEEQIPQSIIEKLARAGYLAADIPSEYKGAGIDMVTYGLLTEEIGKGCSSVRSLLTVNDMAAYAILKCGSRGQKEYWLPRLTTGEAIGALGLTEPNVGSDAKSVETKAYLDGDNFILNGTKTWITFGQIATVFVIIAQLDGAPTAFLVEKGTPGFSTSPIKGIIGTRASMLAKLEFDQCVIPRENLLGKAGFGFTFVVNAALDHGRFSVAWGSVAIAQAALEASIAYTEVRKQFGQSLQDFQLIRRMITDMITQTKAARLLCLNAAFLKDVNDPSAIRETLIAKYYSSSILKDITNDAVQIHGANGCSDQYPVARLYRDAKVMEIIEGSSQMQQITIAKYGFQEYKPAVENA